MEKHEFQPKEWVLVRDDDIEEWKLDIFSHLVDGASFPYICVGGCYSECIPFEGNESLLGKNGTPEEKEDWKVGDKVEVLCKNDDKWYPGKIIDIDSSRIMQFKVESSAFKEWRDRPLWCAADQLRKPEEKPNEEFKFGDWVEVLKDGEWTVGIVTEVDEDDEFATYHVNFPDDDGWCSKSKVRKHEKG